MWEQKRIGEIVSFQNGYAFKSKNFVSSGEYKIIKIKELKNGYVNFFDDTASVSPNGLSAYDKYSVSYGDVLFALTGDPVSKSNPLSWVGRVSIYKQNETALLNQRVCKISAFHGVNPLYIYYHFRIFENFYSLASKATGSASQANISTKTIENEIIRIPDLETQNKIVSVLSSIDDKIESNNNINDNLEQQVQLVYDSYFVTNGFEVERDTTLGEMCKCLLGGTPSRLKPEYWNGNIPWINSGEINRFRITNPSELITEEGLQNSATKLLPKKSVVVAITGATLGQVSLLEIDSCANQSVVGIVPNKSVPYEFLYPFINSNIQELISHQTGGAQQHINKQNVESLTLRLPKSQLIDKYCYIVSPMLSTIAKNCFEIEYLRELRDTLLSKLMSGEIDVSDIEI